MIATGGDISFISDCKSNRFNFRNGKVVSFFGDEASYRIVFKYFTIRLVACISSGDDVAFAIYCVSDRTIDSVILCAVLWTLLPKIRRSIIDRKFSHWKLVFSDRTRSDITFTIQYEACLVDIRSETSRTPEAEVCNLGPCVGRWRILKYINGIEYGSGTKPDISVIADGERSCILTCLTRKISHSPPRTND